MGMTHRALLLPLYFRHFPVDEAGEVTLTLQISGRAFPVASRP